MENLPLTRETVVCALKNDQTHACELNMVVVRLLIVALRVTRWRRSGPHVAGLTIPKGYRTWPIVESELKTDGSRQRLRFYVCPKGASTADDEPFPVGTVFVVETNVLTHGNHKTDSVAPQMDEAPMSIFVMGKYASMHSQAGVTGARESWVYTTYGSEGEVLIADSAACVVCRVPPMQE